MRLAFLSAFFSSSFSSSSSSSPYSSPHPSPFSSPSYSPYSSSFYSPSSPSPSPSPGIAIDISALANPIANSKPQGRHARVRKETQHPRALRQRSHGNHPQGHEARRRNKGSEGARVLQAEVPFFILFPLGFLVYPALITKAEKLTTTRPLLECTPTRKTKRSSYTAKSKRTSIWYQLQSSSRNSSSDRASSRRRRWKSIWLNYLDFAIYSLHLPFTHSHSDRYGSTPANPIPWLHILNAPLHSHIL